MKKSIKKIKIMALTFIAISYHNISYSQTLQKSSIMTNKVITITKVKTPWYGFPFILRAGFKKSIPVFSKVDGLLFKYYASTNNGKLFGGIYLWNNITNAKNQFSDKWFSQVKRKYKKEGKVEYYELISDSIFKSKKFDYTKIQKHSASIFIHNLSQEIANKYSNFNEGLLRSYLVKENDGIGAILLFEKEKNALEFILKNNITTYEIFKTPVLLNNEN